jgi:hypothetical protein
MASSVQRVSPPIELPEQRRKRRRVDPNVIAPVSALGTELLRWARSAEDMVKRGKRRAARNLWLGI